MFLFGNKAPFLKTLNVNN